MRSGRWLGALPALFVVCSVSCGSVTNQALPPESGPRDGSVDRPYIDSATPTDSGPAADHAGCGLRTCASVGANCGMIGDGCGGTINCGTCPSGETCGGGGKPNVCGTMCTPTTCSALGYTCGTAGDGCGGLLDCGTCPTGETCGGGGVHFQCGASSTPTEAGTVTTPEGGTCVPLTCADQKLSCGMTSDGCGHTLNCGTCTAPQTCGGGGTPGVCGTPTCKPLTCATAGATCGMIGDGCGGILSCGTCPTGETCGGGGIANQCAGPSDGGGTCTNLCLKQVKCEAGTTSVSGTVYAPTNCGTDAAPTGFCPSTSCPASGTCADGGACSAPVKCPLSGACPNGTTCAKGSVCPASCLATHHGDPLYGALVYVPNAPVASFTAGVACDTCGAPASGSPLVSTTSGIDGSFVLNNVPAGTGIPIIIQIGRWRRKVVVNVTACVDNPLTPDQTRLARKEHEVYPEDNIPLFAIDTGEFDPMECVLRKMGVDDSQFGDGCTGASSTCATSSSARIQLYRDNGSVIDASTPSASTLYDNTSVLDQYDVTLFECVGCPAGGFKCETAKTPAEQQNVVDYANMGGRVFASHFSYVWLDNVSGISYTNPFASTATWSLGNPAPTPDPMPAYVDATFPKGSALSQWLQLVASPTATSVSSSACGGTTCEEIPVNQPRHDISAVNAAEAQQWVFRNTNSPPTPPTAPYTPMHYTFNTPVGVVPTSQCGRVVFSDFHVYPPTILPTYFPGECGASTPMTPQEKLMEFMLFDLSSCIAPDMPLPPGCTPKTCAEEGYDCGPEGDGCGDIIDCGTCPSGETCGGGGKPGVCGSTCTPQTCSSLGFDCGPAGDGCGGTLACGTCPPGETCGAGGPGKCGVAPDGSTCTPLTCADQGISCGPAGNGCGGSLDCGTCPSGESCGGGGKPGVCGSSCVPTTCAAAGANCGTISDGCGSTLDCGTCTSPDTCGGGGVANVCGILG